MREIPLPAAPPELRVELVVWHHKRRTRRLPYSASAFLVDQARPKARQVIEGAHFDEAQSECEAARGALRGLQEALRGHHDPVVRGALADPVRAITERREAG